MRVIRDEIKQADLPQAKTDSMTQPFSGIAVHPELGKSTKVYPRGVLHELVRRLDEKVWPFISVYHDFDVVGQFYGEFLKYTGGDKKALGIVLTPRHITEIFALIANVQPDSKVLDICAGTAGFLISAMHQMMRNAITDTEKDRIKQEGLIGVEQQPDMFTLAASNMILRGDGKANLHQGSCFDDAITTAIKKHKCNIGLLNPPFSQGDADLHELYFIQRLLDCLEKGGTAVVIVPMSCAISPHPLRAELLKQHTLEAVMSMPDDLFYPVGTVTCIMVFTAKVPHETSNKKTWFGYWKNDGFIKTKHLGRVDLQQQWPSLRDRWVEMFRNREVHAGESVMQKVGPKDEWCAEAYMETDYSKITQDDFGNTVGRYVAFQAVSNQRGLSNRALVDTSTWKPFRLSQLFDLKKGKRLTKAQMIAGETPFIGSIDDNNGISNFVGQPAQHSGNTITVNYNGSVAEAFYQPVPFRCSDDVNVLYPKFAMTPAIGLFVATLIRKEKYRFNYGRKWHLERMEQSEIRLPVKSDDTPDWEWMETYIKTLAFSAQL
jgi:hypothetical protein